MGLRSPQDMNIVKDRPEPNMRFSGTSKAQIDPTFVNQLSQSLDAQEAARIRSERESLALIKARRENENDEFRIKAQAALTEVEGLDTHKVAAEYGTKFKEHQAKTLDAYNPKYHDYLKLVDGSHINQYNSFALTRVSSEYKKVKDKTFETNIANKMNSGIEVSGSDEDFGNSLIEIGQAAQFQAERMYGSDPNVTMSNGVTAGDMVKTSVKQSISETIRRAIEQQASANNLGRGEFLLENHLNDLTPADEVKARKFLETRRKAEGTREAMDLAGAAMKLSGEDLEMGEAHIQTTGKNDSIIKSALSIFRSNIGIQKEAKRRREDGLTADIYGEVIAGKSLDYNKLKLLPPPQQDRVISLLEKNGNKPPVLTDPDIYEKVEQTLLNGTERDVRGLNLNTYAMDLSHKDMLALKSMQNRFISDKNKEYAEVQRSGDRRVGAIVNEYAVSNKIVGKANLHALKSIAREEANRILDTNPRITQRELDAAIKKALYARGMKEVEKDPTLLKPWTYIWPGTKKVPAESLAPQANAGGIDPSWTSAVYAARKRQGLRDFTPDEMNNYLKDYAAKKKVDLSRPRQ